MKDNTKIILFAIGLIGYVLFGYYIFREDGMCAFFFGTFLGAGITTWYFENEKLK
ncbi:hypothetical protein KKH07_02530 [Patescibacteria group bacterium]|nr:hypothetical protein [Patescibacteria group bacterium]MBU1563501.1 hypothetical protein [Patescibacteria group bacterium]